MMNNTVLL